MRYFVSTILFSMLSIGAYAQSSLCLPNFTADPNANMCIEGVRISSFNSGGVSTGAGAGNFVDHTGNPIDVCAGSTYDMTVTVTHNLAFIGDIAPLFVVQAWFDWNDDGIFDEQNEINLVGSVEGPAVPTVLTVTGLPIPIGNQPPTDLPFSFTIPEDAADNVSMRVGITTFSSNDPCVEFTNGEMEDFLLEVNKLGTVSSDQFLSAKDSLDISVNLNNPADPVDWQENRGSGFMDIPSASGLTNLPVFPDQYINAFRAYKDEPACIVDNQGDTRAYTNISNVAVLGANEIASDLSEVCEGDSVNLSVNFKNEKQIFEQAIPTVVIAAANKLGESVLEVDYPDSLMDFMTLNRVCLNVRTTDMVNMAFVLRSPTGSRSLLSLGNGTGFTPVAEVFEFCFSDSADLSSVIGFTAALDGDYNPAQPLDIFNYENPNGEWTMEVYGRFVYGIYNLSNWSMEFGQQNFDGWTPEEVYGDATGTETSAIVEESSFFNANFSSFYGNVADSVFVQAIGLEPIEIIGLNASSENICPNTDLDFTANLNQSATDTAFTWFVNGVEIPNEKDSTVTIANLNPGDSVRVRLEVNNQCNNSVDERSFVLNAIAVEDVQAEVDNGGLNFPVCEGTVVNASATLSNAAPNNSSQWLVNGTERAVDTESFAWIDAQDGDTLIYRIEQEDICGATQIAVDTLIYSSEAKVDLNLDIDLNDDQAFCQNDLVSFNLSVNDPNIAADITWRLNGNNINVDGLNFESSTLAPGSYDLSVNYTALEGCYNNPSASVFRNFTINPSLTPSVAVETVKETLCPNESLSINITESENLGSSPRYQWLVDGEAINGQTFNFLSLPNAEFGKDYQLQVESSVDCPSEPVILSNPVVFTERMLKSADVSLENVSLSEYCSDERYVNRAIISGDAPIVQMEWTVNGSTVTNDLDVNTSLPLGDVQVIFSAFFDPGCGSSIAISEVEDFKVFESSSSEFTLFPSGSSFFTVLEDKSDVNNTNYNWTLNGETFSNEPEPEFELVDGGVYTVCLESSKGQTNVCVEQSCETFTYVGINDIAFEAELTLSPNPTSSEIRIEGLPNTPFTLQVFDNVGKVLVQREYESNHNISVAELSPGTYHLSILQNGKIARLPFVKE